MEGDPCFGGLDQGFGVGLCGGEAVQLLDCVGVGLYVEEAVAEL